MHIVQNALYESDGFASAVGFRGIMLLDSVNHHFRAHSTLHLFRKHAMFLRNKSFEVDNQSFMGLLIMTNESAYAAYDELERVLYLAIQHLKVDYVRVLLEGIFEAERNKEIKRPFLAETVNVPVSGELVARHRSWLFLAITHCVDIQKGAAILSLLLGVNKDHGCLSYVLLFQNDHSLNGSNCIHICAENGELEYVKVLLVSAREAGLLQDLLWSCNNSLESVLYCAIKNEHYEVALELIESARSVKMLPDLLLMNTATRENCLSEAVLSGNMDILRLLIQAARSEGVLDQLLMTKAVNSNNCLHLAIHKYTPHVFSELLQAAQEGNGGVLQKLLLEPCTTGRTCLYDAVASLNTEAVQALLNAAPGVSGSPDTSPISELLCQAPYPDCPFGGMSCVHYIVTCISELEEMDSRFHETVFDILELLLDASVNSDVLTRLLFMKSQTRQASCLIDIALSENKRLVERVLHHAKRLQSPDTYIYAWRTCCRSKH
jgi:hypothetical protein